MIRERVRDVVKFLRDSFVTDDHVTNCDSWPHVRLSSVVHVIDKPTSVGL